MESRIKEYKDKEQEIDELDERIRELERRIILPLKREQEVCKKELQEIGKSSIFSISIQDLVRELSDLTGIPEEEIYVEVDYFEICTAEDYKKEDFLKQENKPLVKLIICSRNAYNMSNNNPQPGDFYYHLTFISDFNELQADGKSLMDHSYIISDYGSLGSEHIKLTSLYIKKEDIMSIICHLNLNNIATSHEERYYYPKDLLAQAIENNERRKKEEAMAKIKRLVI